MDIDQFHAPELQFEPAAGKILKDAGLKVWSAFLQADPVTGEVNTKSIPDNVCFVEFEQGEVTDDIRAFRADESLDQGLASEDAGFTGTLKITHRVPMDDQPPEPGEDPDCYKKLCLQRGKIRRLFRNSARMLKDLIPEYDIFTIRLIQPDRRVDDGRSANQATERFLIRWTAADGSYPNG